MFIKIFSSLCLFPLKSPHIQFSCIKNTFFHECNSLVEKLKSECKKYDNDDNKAFLEKKRKYKKCNLHFVTPQNFQQKTFYFPSSSD